MPGERTTKALARIDAALQRIDNAASRAERTLKAQHARNDHLRQAITETLRDLDLLIAEQDSREDVPA